MLYTICWDGSELVGEVKSVTALAHLLESRKIKFSVFTSGTKLRPSNFGFGGYEYWV